MSWRKCVGAATPVAVALLVCVSWPVRRAAGEEDYSRAILFSGRDIWRNGVFTHSGVLLAPGGFEQDGVMLKLLISGGLYRYRSGSVPGGQVVGAEWQTQVLPGFRIKRGTADMKFFLGPEWQTHWLWPDDPGNSLRGRNFGLRATAELWSEPTPQTLIAGDLSLSTLATSHSARLAFGWRITGDIFNGDSFYAGPEFQYFGSDGYRHGRIGLHITSMKTEAVEWSAAAGFARDSDGHASPYVRLGLAQRL